MVCSSKAIKPESKNQNMKTLADIRDEKNRNEAREESKARVEHLRRRNIESTLAQFPEVGVLSDGTFYAFVGTTRRYFASKFLNAVTDAIIEARADTSKAEGRA